MKIVINRCYGGFGLSHKAVMEYARLSGFKLYAFTEARKPGGGIDFDKHVAWDGKGKEPLIVHYAKRPLSRKGTYEEGAYFSVHDLKRDDPNLIRVVQTLGQEANGRHAELSVCEIPDGVTWEIDDYDGMETVHEVHRSWS